MNKLKLYFKIKKDGSIQWSSDETLVKVFLDHNRGKPAYVEYHIEPDGVKYWQHKYYRGYLLPPFALECYGGNEDEAHDYLKEKFLFKEIRTVSEIPQREVLRCNKYFLERECVDEETGEIKKVRMLYGYTPSLADLDGKRMREYIKKVEMELSDVIGTGQNKEALEARNKAMSLDHTTKV